MGEMAAILEAEDRTREHADGPNAFRNLRFFAPGADILRIRASVGSLQRPSQRVDVDHRQFIGRCLNDCPVVIGLHELVLVGRCQHHPLYSCPFACPFAYPLASKSSLACTMPSRLRWHS
jgi:hypothetical protein